MKWSHGTGSPGARLRFRPGVSVLALPSGARPGSYATPHSPEHDYIGARMLDDPHFRETVLEIAAIESEREAMRFRFCRSWPKAIRAMLARLIGAASIRAGVHPHAIYFALRHGRRGNRINHLRRLAGLGSIPSRRA